MEDRQIIAMFWNRDERAVKETQKKYHRFLTSIAMQILQNKEDSQECVNDTYLRLWNAIPPARPAKFPAFLARLTRLVCIDRYRALRAVKRTAQLQAVPLEELGECIPDRHDPAQALEVRLLKDAIESFLSAQSLRDRNIFVCRYFFFDPLKKIGSYYSLSESAVKSILFRLRKQLKEHLEKEGFTL